MPSPPVPPGLSQHLGCQLTLPHVELGSWPTPVQRLAQLGEQLGVDLWIKRDDLSAADYGGNKVRKLELLLGDALEQRRRSLVTVGGVGSNHIVATAVHGRKQGLSTWAVLFPQPETDHTRKTSRLLERLGVRAVPCRSRLLVPLAWQRAKGRAPDAYLIGPGGSSPLGVVGYVNAAFELKQQIEDGQLPAPDEIIVALGSGGTFAGLLLGCRLAGLRCSVVGVRVVERALVNATLVRLLLARTKRLLRAAGATIPKDLSRGPMIIDHRFFGGRYGRPTTAGREAVDRAFDSEGVRLETTYTGKAMAALIARASSAARGHRVLFWNTYNSRDTSSLGEPH